MQCKCPQKIHGNSSHKLKNKNLKFIPKHKRPWIVQTVWDNENTIQELSPFLVSSCSTHYSNKDTLVLCIKRYTFISGVELRTQIETHDPKISDTWFLTKNSSLSSWVSFWWFFQLYFNRISRFPFVPSNFQNTPPYSSSNSCLLFSHMFFFLTKMPRVYIGGEIASLTNGTWKVDSFLPPPPQRKTQLNSKLTDAL